MNPKQILVIDDEEAVLSLFRRSLEMIGSVVHTAGSGAEGIEKFKASRYHVVFLDLNMPAPGGLETLRAIRQIDPRVPVYIVTGFYDQYFSELNTLGRAENIAFEILQKPVDPRLIQNLVRGVPAEIGGRKEEE